MTKEEALEILKTINEMYPRFNLTKRKAMLLIPNLQKMDYDGVMENLSAFVMDNPYPPMLSEIAAYAEDGDSALAEMETWQEEAKKVSPEVKERFREQFEQLVKQKRGEANEHL
jgi:hypothetical protein